MMRVKTLLSVLLLACSSGLVQGICYDQSPFWFTANATAESLYDDDGNMISNKMRVRWSSVHNFKCVDYFQVEYYNEYYNSLLPNQKQKTEKIPRNKRYTDIDVEPCTEYVFKVAASEDYQGRRDDFKMMSNTVNHMNKYTPQFMSSVSVKERKISWNRKGRSQSEPDPTMLRIQWRVAQIDYPTCLDYFVLDYYDITYNESVWAKTVRKPFPALVIKQDVHSDTVPCHPEFRYILRVFGLFGDETQTDWTPPSCVMTTPPPTTTKKTEAAGFGEAETLEAIVAENEQLEAKIEGLKEENEKIGEEVFKAFFEDFWGSLVYVVAARGIGTNVTDV